MSNTKVTEQEFHSIKKSFRSGATSKEVQAEFKRGETIIRRIRKSRSWPAYQAGNKARIERRKEASLFDTNLTKEQSGAFLEMATNLQLANDKSKNLEKKIKEKDDLIASLRAEISDLDKRLTATIIESARRKRSFWARITRTV